jgi:excisionase family DNA binding protein
MSPDDAEGRWWVHQSKAAAMLGIGRRTLRRMITDGALETVRIGKRDVIRLADIEALRDGQRAS